MRSQSLWLAVAGLMGAAVASLVTLDAWPLLRGPLEWRWALAPAPPPRAIASTAVAVALFVAGWWWLGRSVARRPVRALVALGILTLVLQAALLWAVRPNPADILFERLASDQASGYFTVAAGIEHLPALLREFPERMPRFAPDPHPRSKPPGIILLYWSAEQLLERWPAAATWLGHWGRGVRCGDLALVRRPDAALAANGLIALLTPVLSTALLGPAYVFVTRRRGPAAGWAAAGLVALLPGRLLFAPHMDTVYPLLALGALLAVDTGLRRERRGWTAVGGAVVGVATFLSLVNGLIGLLLALWITFERRPDRQFGAWLKHGAALGAGAALPWAAYWLTSRVTPWAIYLAAAPARHDLARDYWTWLPGNLYDFALFAGLPIFLLAAAAIGQRRLGPLGGAFWLLLTGLLLSGAIRGEVGRIWLMLAPMPVLLAALTYGRAQRKAWLGVVAGTAALTAMLGLRWEVTQLEWPPPQERAINYALPSSISAEPVSFGDVTLLGAEVSARDRLAVTFYWGVDRRPAVPYTTFVHVIGRDGTIMAQSDIMPGQGQVPATCWQTGEVFVDTITVDTDLLPAGSYRVDVGLYDAGDGTRPGDPHTAGTYTHP